MTHPPRLFRVAVHVSDLDEAVRCYGTLLGVEPVRVGPGRCYFHCEGAILVCVDPAVEGHGGEPRANAGHVYFAVDDLEVHAERATRAGCTITNGPALRDWGERSFYGRDPFGNPFCFVDATTAYTALSGLAETATAKKIALTPSVTPLGQASARRGAHE